MAADRIAIYLDGGLSGEEREVFETHLLVCPECRQDLAEASAVAGSGPTRWRVPALAGLAAAAVAILWFAPTDRPMADDARLRGPAADTQLEVISPLEAAITDPDSLIFVWRRADSGSHYVFTLTDLRGDVVFTTPSTDTALVLPRSVGLEPGVAYFWFVDALLDGARSVSSGVREFAVTGR